MDVQPLTRCNSQGVRYVRTPAVTQQITAALALSAGELAAALAVGNPNHAGYLQEETLVYLIRAYWRQGQEVWVDRVSEVLIRRMTRHVNYWLRDLRPDEQEDGFGDVVHQLFARILDQTAARGDFYEVRFWEGLKRLAIDVRKRYRNRQVREDPREEAVWTNADHGAALPPWEAVLDHRLSPETWTLIREAIQSLPPPAQDAFLLRYAFGLPVASQDPDELTVARLLGVSDRTIRTRLQQAEQSLEKWREGL